METEDLFRIDPSQGAKALSSLGAAKGGNARANVLTKEERSDIARRAVTARWAKAGKLKPKPPEPAVPGPAEPATPDQVQQAQQGDPVPFSLFRGKLQMGNIEMECHVLNDYRRVFTQREIVRVLTAGRDSGNLADQTKGNPLITSVETLGEIIRFKVPATQFLAFGREATVLIELCEKYLQASDQGLLKGKQKKLALQASIIIRACAKVGIIALVDEATGFQQFRAKHALQLKLQAFIADELQEWAKMFPDDFWFELARLEGIHYSPRNRPLRWGKYVMAFVYDAIDKDIGKELRRKNPDPHFKKNHHQWLREFGRDKLIGQIQSVITIMKLCKGMSDFRSKFDRVFKKTPLQTSFDDINWTVEPVRV
jgi:hypothetical protein